MTLYNEIEPYAADWLRNLIDAGHLPSGRVDETDMRDLDENALPDTCHFFAGIGGWPLALRMAGWPDDLPVWTGSCPCQPFSQAGRGRGFSDDRHLWPYWRVAIEHCQPAIVFGEQVASPAGRAWFALVRAEMEALGYSVGGADLCAAGVGAPHLRQRLWFVAIADGERLARVRLHLRERGSFQGMSETSGGGEVGSLAYSSGEGLAGWTKRARGGSGSTPVERDGCTIDSSRMGYASGSGGWRDPGAVPSKEEKSEGERIESRDLSHELVITSTDHWSGALWVHCRDGKDRPVEPGIHPLAHGVPCRVGKLRAYGNAIVPQVGAVFIRSVMECLV